MFIVPSLERFFRHKGIQPLVHVHETESSLSTLAFEFGLQPHLIAVPILLQSARKGCLMAVMPLSHSLDLARVAALLRREFDYLDDAGVAAWFPDVAVGAEPPFAEPYQLPCIVDRSLLDNGRIYFRGGTHRALLSVSGDDFRTLMAPFPKAVIANPSVSATALAPGLGGVSIDSLRHYLEGLSRLPAMPAMALTIIRLLHSPETTAADLAEALELDPSLAAQIIRYASSPYFGYRGRVNSVQDAISRVLGFDMVGSIALGIASGQAFDVPQEGPLGLKAFWKHALYCAVVCQSLARKINLPEVNPATAYLCGLLHNMGVLLMGHLFPEAFAELNQQAQDHPQQSLKQLEQTAGTSSGSGQVLAWGHERLGGCLLELWRLPSAVVAACYHHHDLQYRGTDQAYVHLVQLSNRLLAQRQLGDLGRVDAAVADFGSGLISLSVAESVFEKVMEMCTEIDILAEHIAA